MRPVWQVMLFVFSLVGAGALLIWWLGVNSIPFVFIGALLIEGAVIHFDNVREEREFERTKGPHDCGKFWREW